MSHEKPKPIPRNEFVARCGGLKFDYPHYYYTINFNNGDKYINITMTELETKRLYTLLKERFNEP